MSGEAKRDGVLGKMMEEDGADASLRVFDHLPGHSARLLPAPARLPAALSMHLSLSPLRGQARAWRCTEQ